MWLTDPTFPSLVEDSWQASGRIPSTSSSLSRFPRCLEALTKNIQFWNKNHFGNLFHRKTRLLARLRGLQVALARKPTAYLYSLETQLTQEYNTVLHQEYLYWRLNSRIMWLNYGDANTKYFHIKTIQRRCHSRVVTLKDDTGLWLTRESLSHHIHNAFKNLFQATSASRPLTSRTTRLCCPNSPFSTQAQVLTRIPQPEEILLTLRDLPPLKAPGPDGYHALFFQSNWTSLGPSIIQVFQDIFEHLTIPPSWGTTSLVLIPKVAHLELINQFHPISLYNTLYKLLSHIIVHRLKPCMAKAINPCQAGFVPGRRTSDNIIIGDPLSPYLFILCLERLSIKLDEAVRDKLIHPINFRTGVRLSHLFFIDDVFLFTRAITRDCKNLYRLLQNFRESSGQLISVNKSRTWFSPRTPRRLKEQVVRILGLPTTVHIGTYLGMPIFTTRHTTSSYQYLVDNIRKQIEGWQAKYLSMAGRATLVKAFATSIPIYAMQTTLLPQKICHQIDQLCSNFLWGDTEHHRSCHTVNWETVTRPKEARGLGLSSTRHRNHAILMNQAWRLLSNPTSLWARVLKAKYFPHTTLFTSPRTSRGSHIWTALPIGAKLLFDGMRWVVGDGATIRIWKDHWLPNGSL
nr:putative ribonuclease h protein [Quercus suber]